MKTSSKKNAHILCAFKGKLSKAERISWGPVHAKKKKENKPVMLEMLQDLAFEVFLLEDLFLDKSQILNEKWNQVKG